MAVQILPANPKRSFGEKINAGLGYGLNALENFMNQRQQEQKAVNEYEQENETYKSLTGRDLSKNPKTREKEIEYALRGEQELKKGEFKKKTKAEEAAEKLRGEDKTQKQLMTFADKLEAKDPKFAGIADVYRLDIPLDQKTKIVQSITGTDIYREDQQRRLMLDSTLKRYNLRLKELDDDIKSIKFPLTRDKEAYTALVQQRSALRNERDQLLDFKSLNYEDDEENDFESDEEAMIEDEEESPKVAFNPKNEKHQAVAKKLYEKYRDKEKVRKELMKHFKGL